VGTVSNHLYEMPCIVHFCYYFTMTFNIEIETEKSILRKSDWKVHAGNVPLSFIFMDCDLIAPQIHQDSRMYGFE
jgi:hypothetical protein